MRLRSEKRFFFGDQPHELDATLFAFLANVLWAPVPDEMQVRVRAYPRPGPILRKMLRHAIAREC